MLSFFFWNNIHLGIELFGGIVFFISGWLFAEAFFLKRDVYSLGRAIGFELLALWQIFYAIGSDTASALFAAQLIELCGLLFITLTYVIERLPPKPEYKFTLAGITLPAFEFIQQLSVAKIALLVVLFAALISRYTRDIDRALKWLVVGIALLAASALLIHFAGNEVPNPLWISGQALEIAAFAAIALWVWWFLSLRMRDEALIIFISISLFIALLVTTTFSTFFLQQIHGAARTNLKASAKIFSVYVQSLSNRALAAAQIVGSNEEFGAAIAANDLASAEEIGVRLLRQYEQDFLDIADEHGRILIKTDTIVTSDENILREAIAANALAGHPGATIESESAEGFSIRAAAPIVYQGGVLGVILTGTKLDRKFVNGFRDASGFQTTIAANGVVLTSTLLSPGEPVALPSEESVQNAQFANQEVIGGFTPIMDGDGNTVAMAAITTTPGELLRNAQQTNLTTMIIIFLITISLIIPLYRFTVFLTIR